MKYKNKTIGILGGMGPIASATLYARILSYSQQNYGAVQDSDYPPIVINSLTLDGFDETGIVNPELVKKQLIEGVVKLEKAGCHLIIIGCNTVHIFYKEMQNSVKIPILNIVEETKNEVLAHRYRTVGLFASESTLKTKLYQNIFSKSGIITITANANQQKILNLVIEHVMGGNQKVQDIIALKEIARDFNAIISYSIKINNS